MEPQATPPTPVPPPATPPMKNSLLTIMSLLLITATGLAGFFYWQMQRLSKQLAQYQSQPSPTPSATPDVTANWKIYTYDTFLIKLPPEWHTTQLKNPVQFLNYTPTVGGDFDPLTDKGKLKIEIYKNRSLISLREYLDSQKTGPLELKSYSEAPSKIDRTEAIKVTTSNLGFSYYVKIGDYIYSLVFGLDFNNYTGLADQILSTFKFTEENQSKTDCKNPRPEVCTMECIETPPYICGSDGKSYCSVCQACSNKNVAWYEMKASACEE